MNFDENMFCYEAILKIYFSEIPSVEIDGKFPDFLKRVVLQELTNVPNSGLNDLSDTNRKLAENALKITKQIKLDMPGINPKRKLHSLLWTNWAVGTSKILPTNLFFKKLLEWRLKLPRDQLYLMQYKSMEADEDEEWNGSPKDCEFGRTHGYSIDAVILGKKIRGDRFSLNWRMKTYVLIGARQSKTDKTKLKPAKRARGSKTIEQICGSQLIDTLNDCVTKAAKSGRISALSKRKSEVQDGRYRYLCSISRDELVGQLTERYPRIAKYRNETIKRALPSVVQCPRGKSKAGPRKNS